MALNVRHARAQAGLTQDEVAASGVVSKSQYQEIERGKGNPTADTLYGIARVLKTNAAALLDMGPSPFDSPREAARLLERRRPQKRNWDAIAATQQAGADVVAQRKRRKKAKAPKKRG